MILLINYFLNFLFIESCDDPPPWYGFSRKNHNMSLSKQFKKLAVSCLIRKYCSGVFKP